MRIKYITNVRLPTDRASGYAIMKMCSEFSKVGVATELFVPKKGNNDNKKDPFDFYKIERDFEIKRIPSFDFLAITLRFGKLLYWLDLLSFVFMSRFKVKLDSSDIFYTRDFMTTLFFSKGNFIVLELHNISSANFLFKMAIRKAKLFFVLNNNLKKDLILLGVSPEVIFISPSGVELNDFDIDTTKEEARGKLDLPQDKKIVLYTGQFYPWKGVDTLAETAKLLPEVVFVFVGGADPELSIFKNKYGNVNNIIIRSFQERYLVAPYLLASDVLVLPNSGKQKISSHYTSPLKLFEYMASKRPIVSSDLPSIREVLTEENCVFATPDSPESFAEAIKKVLNDSQLVESISLDAYNKVQQYSWKERTARILNVIKQNHD